MRSAVRTNDAKISTAAVFLMARGFYHFSDSSNQPQICEARFPISHDGIPTIAIIAIRVSAVVFGLTGEYIRYIVLGKYSPRQPIFGRPDLSPEPSGRMEA